MHRWMTVLFLALSMGFGSLAQAAGFGALAYNKQTGRSGYSYDASTRYQAESLALQYCGNGCVVLGFAQGSCLALAVGDGNGYGWSARQGYQQAEQEALNQCRQYNRNCRITVNSCDRGQKRKTQSGSRDGSFDITDYIDNQPSQPNTGYQQPNTGYQQPQSSGQVPMVGSRAPVQRGGPSMLYVHNATMLNVQVFWVNQQGQEQLYKALGPRQTYNQQTHAGHNWVVRDSWSGVELARHNCRQSQENLQISDSALRSWGSQYSVYLTLNNTLQVPVDAYWIDSNGSPQFYKRLGAYQSIPVQTNSYSAWKFYTLDGSLVGMFVTRQASPQQFNIAPR